MIIGIGIGIVLLVGLAFTIYKLETAPTFEQAFPNFHQQCSDCNKGGDSCPTCLFRDKDYSPVKASDCDLDDEDGYISPPPRLPEDATLVVYNGIVDTINHLDGIDGKIDLDLVRGRLDNITKLFKFNTGGA